MSTVRVRYLACNKPLCISRFFTGDGSAPGTVLRHQARAAGWTEHGDQHYCPRHKPWPGFASWLTPETAAHHNPHPTAQEA